MRVGITILALLTLTVGCASKPVPPSAQQLRLNADLMYVDGQPAALAMDPPIIQNNPRVNLNRDPRQPSAFVSFDQTTTTISYVRMDDRQIDYHDNDMLERRAFSVQVSTSYR